MANSDMMYLGDEDNIDFAICPGHVDAKTFNEKYLADWESDPVHEDDIKHEYWKNTGGDRWQKCDPSDAGAQPFTVNVW